MNGEPGAIRPIETRYKGYRFRSRLEARWAVFFDAMGIAWEYEVEGHDLGVVGPPGDQVVYGKYLPDFEAMGVFVEVKPEGTDQSCADGFADAALKLPRLRDLSGRGCLLIQGSPWPGSYRLAYWNSRGGDDFGVFGECRRCDPPAVWFFAEDGAMDLTGCRDEHRCSDRWPLAHGPSLTRAFAAARSARFEHGESGAPGPHA